METTLDAAASQDAAEAAIAQAGAAADATWMTDAMEAIKLVASSRAELTSDDLWGLIDKPREPRALGAAMRRAAAEGLIESTGRTQKTAQVSRHSGWVTVWKSCLFTAQEIRA